jgi:hypothetical protein
MWITKRLRLIARINRDTHDLEILQLAREVFQVSIETMAIKIMAGYFNHGCLK